MSIQVGQKLPAATFKIPGPDGPQEITTDEVFAGKTVALFALPGAFTPTCSARHVPGFRDNAGALKAKGVDTIACLSVNDVWVMKAWAKDQGVEGIILMLADGSAAFTHAIGMELDLTNAGMGVRSRRYSMLVRDGVVEKLFLEPPGEFGVSTADHLLENM